MPTIQGNRSRLNVFFFFLRSDDESFFFVEQRDFLAKKKPISLAQSPTQPEKLDCVHKRACEPPRNVKCYKFTYITANTFNYRMKPIAKISVFKVNYTKGCDGIFKTFLSCWVEISTLFHASRSLVDIIIEKREKNQTSESRFIVLFFIL